MSLKDKKIMDLEAKVHELEIQLKDHEEPQPQNF